MADRPKGFGMTAELAEKKAAKFDTERAQQATSWIEALTGESVRGDSMDNIHEDLKDGKILCKLINVLSPGSVRKINDSKMAFKMMENIGNFLTGCGSYGLHKSDSFQTVDLYEKQNIPLVIDTIHAVGRKAQKKSFNGPTLGPKESEHSKREFTEEQLQAGKNVIGLQMGSNKGASQAGMSAYGNTRHIMD